MKTSKEQNGLVTSYSYDAANQLQSEQTAQGNTAYSYDLNGNLVQKVQSSQTTTFGWNSQNFLVSVSRPDGMSESYTYCGEGIRKNQDW